MPVIIGTQSASYPFQMTAERVAAFAAAIGANDQQFVPPTFLTVFRQGEFELCDTFGIPVSRLLHGEQEYQYFQPLTASTQITYQTELKTAATKKSSNGPLHFLNFETIIQDAKSKTQLARSMTTLIVRGELEIQTPGSTT